MNGAEFRTLRESLNIQRAWLMKQAGIERERTLIHYEQCDTEQVKPFIADILTQCENMVKEQVDLLYMLYGQRLIDKKITMVELFRFNSDKEYGFAYPDYSGLPYQCYGAVLGRLLLRLQRLEQCEDCRIRLFNRSAFDKWLNGRPFIGTTKARAELLMEWIYSYNHEL